MEPLCALRLLLWLVSSEGGAECQPSKAHTERLYVLGRHIPGMALTGGEPTMEQVQRHTAMPT